MPRLTIHEGKSHSTICVHGVDRNNCIFTKNNLTSRRVAKEFQRVCSFANWCSVNTMHENNHGKSEMLT
jgi:rRNA maturation protein Rpf1